MTGFEAAWNVKKTPSGELAKMWAKNEDLVPGAEVRSIVLPQIFRQCTRAVCAEIEAFRPDAVVMYGATPKNDVVRIERFAINVEETAMGDNARVPVPDRPVIPGGPAAYETTLPFKELIRALDEAKVRGRLSYNAGQHVCNASFYGVRHYLEMTGRGGIPCGFVHVPFPAEFGHGILDDESGIMGFDEIRRASVAITTCLTQG